MVDQKIDSVFPGVISQRRAKEILRSAMERDRLPHALLFHGPEGVGKDAMALGVARHLNCLAPPCHTCPSCLKISRGNHPDVNIIIPVPSKLKPEAMGELIQQKAQQPYVQILFPQATSISIEAIRDLQRSSSFKPFEGRYRVAIISQADRMTNEAGNAFLKTLEEPPAQTLFILTTARLHRLLPTIISRCQQLRFDPLSEADIEEALARRLQVDPVRARLASRLAMGNYHKAEEFLNDETGTSRDKALELLRAGLSGTVAEKVEMAEAIAARAQGDELKNLLILLLLWERDLLRLIEEQDTGQIVNSDRIEELILMARAYSSSQVRHWVAILTETLDLIDRNVNQSLALIGLMLRLHRPDREEERNLTTENIIHG